MNLLKIAEAWVIASNPTPEQKLESERRLKICNSCEKLTFISIFNSYFCSGCGCPIKKKIFSEKESCPINNW